MATKKKKRKPSRATTAVVKVVKPKYLSSAEIRRTAEADFLKDADSKSVDWHYKNGNYAKHVAIDTYRSWAKKGEWVKKRIAYWAGIQERLLSHMADKILERKLAELGEMQEVKDALVQMLKPLRDPKTGKIKIDPNTNLPMFAVELPPFDRLTKAFLDLDLRIGLRTGDVTNRIETVNEATRSEGGSVMATATDPVSHLMTISKVEAEKLARRLLLERNKGLGDGIIDVESETDDGQL
jgi:hypothetical protein